MMDDDLDYIYEEYLPQYIEAKVLISPRQLERLMTIEAHNARVYHRKLPDPKTCSVEIYTQIWVRDVVLVDLVKRSTKEISAANPPDHSKYAVRFLNLFPEPVYSNVRGEIYNTDRKDRVGIWESFNLPLSELAEVYKGRVNEQNAFAKRKGFNSKIEMQIHKDGIPSHEYQRFINNIDTVIEYCNKQLPVDPDLPDWFYKEFNTPCFLCRVKDYSFANNKETYEWMEKQFSVLKPYTRKIEIVVGNDASMFYNVQRDIFEVTYFKEDNKRHQSFSLIHELGHVVYYLQNFQNDINVIEQTRYQREKANIAFELILLKKEFPELYKAKFCDILNALHVVLFELELYKNPQRDLNEFNAQMFNRCFKNAKQNMNRAWLMSYEIAYQPFLTLRHNVANVNIILDIMNNKLYE